MENNNKCCGSCRRHLNHTPYCGEDPCNKYISNREARHHTAVLIQANRYRRDNNVPAIYRMPDPKDLGAAIDFAIKYIKQFSEI